MKKYTHVLWDFNGTLIDDVQLNFDILNTMLNHYHKKPMQDIASYRSIFGFPVIDFYVEVGFDFEEVSFHDLAVEYTEAYRLGSTQCKAIKHSETILKYLAKKDIVCSIISAAQQDLLIKLVDNINLHPYFHQIMGLDSIYANSKVDLARKWLIDNKVNPNSCLFIGDTVHDFEVAQALGCDCVLSAQGHQSTEILLKCGVPVIENLLELNTIIL